MAARAVRPYRNRWIVEEGNKKLKQFMARTKSDDHCFRFFNMGFSIILYNVWRLVDLLVQLSLEREYDYSPLVTADEFLTCAEEHFDLDTPPPPTVRGAV
jgi:IS4 transposase